MPELSEDGLRLNLGCGGTAPDGWVSADRVVTKPGQTLLDLRDSWPFAERSASGIVLHHVLDLFTADESWSVLLKCHRALKLGGTVRISGADIIAGVERAVAGNVEWFAEQRGSLEETLGWFVTQGGARRQFLTATAMTTLLNNAGFPHVYLSRYQHTLGPDWMVQLDDRERESFFVEAIR